jgi:glycolate oxidase FAD binding subunit
MASSVPLSIRPALPEFAERCHGIVGAEHVRAAGPRDAFGGVAAQLVVEPRSEAEVAAVLRVADEVGIAVAPRGGGSKLAWGNPPARLDVPFSPWPGSTASWSMPGLI